MGRKKPTNKEIVQAIVDIHNKVDYLCSATQHIVTLFIEFSGKSKEFKEYLKEKRTEASESAKKEQDTKKSK